MGAAFLYCNGVGGRRREMIVTAATGSTVTCSKDGKVKTTAEENGVWTFKNLEYGTWTVTGTLGEEIVSREVVLGPESVTLDYRTWLYKDGDLMGYSWTAAAIGSGVVPLAPTVTNGEASLTITGKTQTWAEGAAYISAPIDLTDRAFLGLELAASPDHAYLQIWSGVPAAPSTVSYALSELVTEVDVSRLSGEHYIGIYLHNRSGTSSGVEIAKMYLSGGSGSGSGGSSPGGTTALPDAEEEAF